MSLRGSLQDIARYLESYESDQSINLNDIIDYLYSYNYSLLLLPNEKKVLEDILLNLKFIASGKGDEWVSKFNKLMYFLIKKQKLQLSDANLHNLIEFTISSIQLVSTEVKTDLLFTLSALLNEKPTGIGKYLKLLLGSNKILSNFLTYSESDKSSLYGVFQCLHSLLKNINDNSMSDEQLNVCYQACLLVIKDKSAYNSMDITTLKLLIIALKCLQQIFSTKNAPVKNFGELLGSLKTILFYGLPGQAFSSETDLLPTLKCPDISHPHDSMSESDSIYPKVRKQRKSKRRVKKSLLKKQKNNEDDSNCDIEQTNKALLEMSFSSPRRGSSKRYVKSSSSDSEFSDAENHNSDIKLLSTSIRRHAYTTLQAIVEASDKRELFGYWSAFLPEHPNMPGLPNNINIFTTILKDPVEQIRLCALTLLVEMLKGSKQFLSHADSRNARSMSFTSLSSILASMITEIHRCLFLALVSENNNLLLTQILKCYASLCENVPYVKLNKDILYKFLKNVKGYINHTDIQVQIASLTVFGSISSSDQTPKEFERLILTSDFDFLIDMLNQNTHQDCLSYSVDIEEDEIPWIVSICKKNIYGEEPLPLKIQSINLLSIVVGKYFCKSKSFLNVISEIVLLCLKNDDPTIKLHGAKLLDVFGRCTCNAANAEVVKNAQTIISYLWQSSLLGPLLTCISCTDKTLQGISCDCISSLPAEEFESLLPSLQIFYITTLLGLAADSNVNLRGAAIRCLGLFCLFPCLNQDLCFMDDLSVIFAKMINDSNANVRFKASWAMGNLSDALFLNKDKFIENKTISPLLLYSIGMTCIEYFKDCDRVKANAVRALGNFLFFIPEYFLSLPTIQDFIKNACAALQSALSVCLMKVCWNACYALGNVFKNKSLVEYEFMNMEELLTSLLKTLTSPNFKVRISAVQSLCCLTNRKYFGSLYCHTWKHLISALCSATKHVNFKEIKHQENLCDQICLTLCKLLFIIVEDDVQKIGPPTLEEKELLLTSMFKFGSHLSREKSEIIPLIIENLYSINKLRYKSVDKHIDVYYATLLDILNQSIIAFYEKN